MIIKDQLRLALLTFIAGVAIGVLLMWHDDRKTVICQFKTMPKEFLATVKEAESNSSMITVTQGGRTFMFHRDNLIACFEPE